MVLFKEPTVLQIQPELPGPTEALGRLPKMRPNHGHKHILILGQTLAIKVLPSPVKIPASVLLPPRRLRLQSNPTLHLQLLLPIDTWGGQVRTQRENHHGTQKEV